MKKQLARFLVWLITLALFPVVNWTVEVALHTPTCCGEVEFTSSYWSVFGETFYYQCQSCKRTFMVHNQHHGISLTHLWFLLFYPKVGDKSVR